MTARAHARLRLGRVRARDLALPPNLVSLARLPLAAAFPLVAAHRPWALAVLALAGASDVLDGWLARRSGQTSGTGAVVDPIADKVFALSVVVTLVARGALPPWGVFALFARELVELPLLLWLALLRHERQPRGANALGKVATVAQFVAIACAVAVPAVLPQALVLAAALSATAGLAYGLRELSRVAPRSPAP